MVTAAMKTSIQAMFYACDYSTKPNMVCAPLLVAIRDGLRRLEDRLKEEDEAAQVAEVKAQFDDKRSFEKSGAVVGHGIGKRRRLTKLEDDARRRLIRQATAANQAVVKGNCLMAMQILTGREVLRTHFPWQLMLKHPMWMAFQHRRALAGADEKKTRTATCC